MTKGGLRTGLMIAAALVTVSFVPAKAQDRDMERHMRHRMMRHEMHREMRHRMMRHEMHREMRHRMMRHEMRREMRGY